MTRNSCTQR